MWNDGATILTERDYLSKVALMGRTSRTTCVGDIMSTPVITVTLGTPVDSCMAIMTKQRTRHLPVLSEGRLVGLVSPGDLVKFRLEEQQREIVALVDYIRSGAAA